MSGENAAAPVTATTAQQPGPEPRAGLFNRPLTSDVLFWVGIVLMALMGFTSVRGAIRTVSSPFGVSTLWWTELITIAIVTPIFACLVLLLPAAIRSWVRKSRRRKALATRPATTEASWQVDPLDATRYRWWTGSAWGDVVVPAPAARGYGTWGVLILAAVFVLPFLAFAAWGASNTARVSGTATTPVADNPNIDIAVATALQSLNESTGAFLSVPVDENDVRGSMMATAAKLPAVQSDYDYFHEVMKSVTSQGQLGSGAPSLASLRQVDTAMAEWLEVRTNYLNGLKNCEMYTDQSLYFDCMGPVFDRFESSLQSTMFAAKDAFEAVAASSTSQS
jgi:hypothetical protein